MRLGLIAEAVKKHFYITAHAWKGNTHSDIISKGVEILKNDGYDSAYGFYFPYISTLSDASRAPDRRDDMDKGNGYHYYNVKSISGKEVSPSFSGYYRSGKNLFSAPRYTRSARTIFEDDYQLALSFYAMGGEANIKRSMEYVARCVHMISDVCCTPHTTDLTLSSVYGNRHMRFEYRANDIFAMFTASHGDCDIYEEYRRCETAGENFNLLAEVSASFYDVIVRTEAVYELDGVIEQLLMLAQKHAAAFLIKFYNDVNSESAPLVPEGVYRLINSQHNGALMGDKSFESGFGISKSAVDCDCSLIKLSVNQSGYYELRLAQSDEHVVLAKSNRAKDKSYGFKIAKTASGYRLLSSLSGYTKALAAGNGGGVGMAAYDPDNRAQHWIIERIG